MISHCVAADSLSVKEDLVRCLSNTAIGKVANGEEIAQTSSQNGKFPIKRRTYQRSHQECSMLDTRRAGLSDSSFPSAHDLDLGLFGIC